LDVKLQASSSTAVEPQTAAPPPSAAELVPKSTPVITVSAGQEHRRDVHPVRLGRGGLRRCDRQPSS
jgi:hypothetical protein